MKTVPAFQALAHDIRLSAFRLLVQAGPGGLAAGRIALELGVPASTLSAHLNRLEQAALIHSRRERQRILYSVNPEGTRELVRFLLEDCCGGNPHVCGVSIKEADTRSAGGN